MAAGWRRRSARRCWSGTQDMLLSRALIRGYASSRAIWPMEFAFLRRGRGSATLDPRWLATVDHSAPAPASVVKVDPTAAPDGRLARPARAAKTLTRSPVAPASPKKPDMLSLLFEPAPSLALVHSRFRPADRGREMGKVIGPGEGNPHGRIVVATQAVEAGVDISAAVMFIEIAPWSSMVQRFGRANRYAKLPDGAEVHWIDLLQPVTDGTASDKDAVDLAISRSLCATIAARRSRVGCGSQDRLRSTPRDTAPS